MPDFEQYGFSPSKIVYQQSLYDSPKKFNNPITKNYLLKISEEIKNKDSEIIYVQLDIETWLGKSPISSPAILDRYKRTLIDFKKLMGSEYKVGYYRIAPAWAHWNLPQNKAREVIWNLENSKRQVIADASDVLYPALYTYTENVEDWLAVAEKVLVTSRKMAKGKPVIPFIWPRFHGSSHIKGEDNRYLPRKYWRTQLEFLRKHADGLIIWNDGLYTEWDENAPWWIETKLFLKSHEK